MERGVEEETEKFYNSLRSLGSPERSHPFNSLVACLAIYLMKSSFSRPP